MHFRDHAYSEYVLYVGIDRKGAEFIGNKHTHLLAHSQTHSALYISSDVSVMIPKWRSWSLTYPRSGNGYWRILFVAGDAAAAALQQKYVFISEEIPHDFSIPEGVAQTPLVSPRVSPSSSSLSSCVMDCHAMLNDHH